MAKAIRLYQGEELRKRASELGVSTVPGKDTSQYGTILEPALQQRVLAAEAWQDARTSKTLSRIATVVSIVRLSDLYRGRYGRLV